MKAITYQYIKKGLSKSFQKTRILIAPALAILITLILSACTDELLQAEPDSPPVGSDEIVEIELPGIIGININQGKDVTTRGDDSEKTSDDKKFADGLDSEYALATPQGSEYYHYLLLYKNQNSYPLIFPITPDITYDRNPNNNLTLKITKVLKTGESGELNDEPDLDEIASATDLGNYLKNAQGYVLLNFQLTDDPQNYSHNGGKIEDGTSTVVKLSKLKRSELEALQLKDYKIHVRTSSADAEENGGTASSSSQDYFIMSSSVYSNGSARIVDYNVTVNDNSISTNEETAKANPAITVYVERLAAKYTVSFDQAAMKRVGDNFGPDNKQKIIDVRVDPETGLPIIDMDVEVVNMVDHPGGIIFNSTDGYKIDTRSLRAHVKIIGFGVSNMETSSRLIKNINYQTNTTSWNWNDANNNRCYWSLDNLDTHYQLRRGTGKFTRAQGYPHQFRLALDTDTVTSYHDGLDGKQGYTYDGSRVDDYKIGNVGYTAYNQLGTIDLTKVIDGVYLQYKSFSTLLDEFDKLEMNSATKAYYPIYSHENTYLDQAMLTSGADFVWKWQRAPYGTATNLIVMAQIEIEGNTTGNETVSGSDQGDVNGPTQTLRALTRDDVSPRDANVRTVYLGQNNIFYLHKRNLLNSKLKILNDVMLSGGNAGLQILHGLWDQHARWDANEPSHVADLDKTHLDKVAWNEGSKLWFGKIKEYKESTDSKGNTIYVPVFEENYPVLAKVDPYDNMDGQDDTDLDLDLIPAEISGGDGQALIAPGPGRMGARWKYYLAPQKEVTTETTDPVTGEKVTKTTYEMDMSQAVDISYNHLVALIHKIIGPVDVYTNGYMYFSVPVPHRYQTIQSDNWIHIGAFSVVRNNWYNIQVDQITKMGTPVHDLGQPIVPVMDVKRSYINMGVKLLNWHNIKEDNIPLM